MKKVLAILLIISMLLILSTKEEYIIIPEESIRFRIIPNSNSIEDMFMKEKIKGSIVDVINDIEKSNTIDESRVNIKDNIDRINNNINTLFNDYNYNKPFIVSYGMNYFPEKVYKGVKYKEGNYESMVIKVGNASGNNYWCVLFPPLCMMDAKENDKVEYKFFAKEIIDKFINKK